MEKRQISEFFDFRKKREFLCVFFNVTGSKLKDFDIAEKHSTILLMCFAISEAKIAKKRKACRKW